MRIAVVGTHGTGKTTLCRAIANKLHINFIPDIVPDAFRLNFPINENTPPETQFWILSKQLELERNTPESWIVEKSLWDNIFYGSFSIKDKEVISVIKKIVNSNAKYDIVFYLPIEFPIADDGLRSLNVKFQKAIDKKLVKYLDGHHINYQTLSGSVKVRVKKALDSISKMR
jgi:nicotinamide riboside kinase